MSSARSSRITGCKGVNRGTQDLRRKRQEQSLELRKAARENQLQKRRAFATNDDAPLSPPSPSRETEMTVEEVKLPTLEEIYSALCSRDPQAQLHGARSARKTLSREVNPPIDDLIKAGCVPKLVEMLLYDNVDIQFEAAWALTNIASGTSDQTRVVIENNAIEPLIRLVSASNMALREQALWALGNIAGDCAQERDKVLNKGIMKPLLATLENEGNATMISSKPASSIMRTAVWTLSNLCRNKNPLVDFEKVKACLPTVSKILHTNDKEVLADACWALSYLTDGPDERIEAVQSTDVLKMLVPLLGHPALNVQTPALRAIGNMVTGNNEQTQRVLEAGALPLLRNLLQSMKIAIVKEAAWTACNILAGNNIQRDMFIEADLLGPLVKVLSHSDVRCQREAAFAVTNLAIEGTVPQLGALLSAGALKPYVALLNNVDPRIIHTVLDGLSSLLRQADLHGEKDSLCMAIEEDGGLDKLEALQNHQNEEIYKKTLAILDEYFTEEDENGGGLAPQQNNGEFQFNAGTGHIGGF